MLTELEDRLSVVPRWSIVRTIQQQSVAEHSFRVALIADRIAKDWFNITSQVDLYRINQYALRHDASEAITGDIPAIVNDMFDHEGLTSRYSDIVSHNLAGKETNNIVKIADYIEALLFLNTERVLGNTTVHLVYRDVHDNFVRALDKSGNSKAWVDNRVSDLNRWMALNLQTVEPNNRRPK